MAVGKRRPTFSSALLLDSRRRRRWFKGKEKEEKKDTEEKVVVVVQCHLNWLVYCHSSTVPPSALYCGEVWETVPFFNVLVIPPSSPPTLCHVGADT